MKQINELNHEAPVVIARAGSLGQADVICAVLRTNDIDSFIINEHVSHNLPHLGLATQPNGIRIAVPQAYEAGESLPRMFGV